MPNIYAFNPIALSLGPIEIRWYGLVYVFGFIITFLWLNWLVNKKEINMTKNDLYDWVFYLMLAVLVGSRLFHIIFWDPIYYLTNPLHIFAFWEGGMSFHGGFFGVVLTTYLFWLKRLKNKISLAKLLDVLAIPSLFALALGRIANFINGELPGKATDFSWCWYFPGYDGCRHPQVLYSAAKRFAIVGWLLFLFWKNVKAKFKDGFIAVNMLTLVGLGRFIIDFWRDDPTFLTLTAGQYLSLVMILSGIYVWAKYYKKDTKKIFKSFR